MVARIRLFNKVLFPLICLVLMLGLAPAAPRAMAVPASAPTAATVPSGFTDELVTSAPGALALAFLPDGRMLITLKGGQLVVRKGSANITALDISRRTCPDGEQGLLGVAVDPAFGTNNYVYVYYTVEDDRNNNRCVNRVSRFTMSGDQVVSGSERVLIVRTPYQDASNHNGGDVHFGGDGKLYISVGDGGCDYNGTSGCAGNNDAARERHTLLGKILRINKDGSIPSDNPYTGSNSGRCNVDGRTSATWCQETFAWGLRNPFRFAFNPNFGNSGFHVNDVGQNAWEEIDRGVKGADYGWNCREGNHSNNGCSDSANFTDPIAKYSHNDTGCSSITGGAFVPNGVWPTSYNDNYLYGDYVCNKIFRLTYSRNTGEYTASTFASNLGGGGPVHMTFGPAGSIQALYYTTFANGGEVRRIRYTGNDNRAPIASISSSANYGRLPLTVSFDATGSRDPEGGALYYNWDFDGNGTIDSRSARATYTYTQARNYTAKLRVWDPRGAAGHDARVVYAGGYPPNAPTISGPATFSVGQTITLSGSGTDPDGDTLSLSWTVLRRHNTHTHPYTSGAGSRITFEGPAPEDLAATTNSYLDVYLKATDPRGMYHTRYMRINPRKVSLTFKTANPAGLNVVLNGTTYDTGSAGKTAVSWEGYRITASAPSPQAGKNFYRWTGPAGFTSTQRTITITTPSAAATYTAEFR